MLCYYKKVTNKKFVAPFCNSLKAVLLVLEIMKLFPKTPDFFSIFEKLAKFVKQEGRILSELKIGSPDLESITDRARKFELNADSICHHIYYEANTTFITPIDREDIYILAKKLDNIVDLTENLIANIFLYKVQSENEYFREFAETIEQATSKVYELISSLKAKDKKNQEIKRLIVEINKFESKGDDLLKKAISSLFSNNKDAIEVIKWKVLYENMEEVLDECEDVAFKVEEIIIKNF